MRYALRDFGEADFSVKEQTDRRFVRAVEHRAAVALEGGGVLREIQRRERLVIRGEERQLRDLCERHTRHLARNALRPRQRQLNGQTHIRQTELRDDRAVRELHGGVHDALAVDNDLDVLGWQVVQPHRLDEFKALVHHGRGVDGDFRAHRPVRVRKRLFARHAAHFLELFPEERAARRGEQDFRDGVAVRRLHALENGRVLGVHRQDAHAFFPRRLHDDAARADERFLVRKGDVLSRVNGRERRQQADHAHNGGHNDVSAACRGALDEAVHAGQHPDARVRELCFQGFRRVFVERAYHFRMQGTRLLLKQVYAPVGRQSDNLGVDRRQNIDRLRADRTRTS